MFSTVVLRHCTFIFGLSSYHTLPGQQVGSTPIYVGFGSMGNDKPGKTTEIILAELRETRIRAVINSGWADFGEVDLAEDVMIINKVSHDKLFPLLSGIVHHGGVGTTHTAAI